VCDDGVQNGKETDVDCGGDDCKLADMTTRKTCALGQGCGTGKDCDTGWCAGGRCQSPPLPGTSEARTIASTVEARVVDDPGHCESPAATDAGLGGPPNQAIVLRLQGHNDWGAIWGDYGLADSRRLSSSNNKGWVDGTGWDGIALWARTGPSSTEFDAGIALPSDRAVTLQVNTRQSKEVYAGVPLDAPADQLAAARAVVGTCNSYSGQCQASGAQTYVDPNDPTRIVTIGNVLPTDSCGNVFKRTLVTTEEWQLFFLPFGSFQQDPLPNASPKGIDPSEILEFNVFIGSGRDRGATLEFWLDDIGFYKAK
jgi:hypothetical protein